MAKRYPMAGDLQSGMASRLTTNPARLRGNPGHGGGDRDDPDDEPDSPDSLDYEQPGEDDIITSDHRRFYQNRKLVVSVGVDENWEPAVIAFMETQRYYPNVWFISDHGNAVLLDPFEKPPGHRRPGVANPARRAEVNDEGMTWTEWARAAFIPAPHTPTLHRAAHRDWKRGVDPTEWRAHIETHGYPEVNPASGDDVEIDMAIRDGMARAIWVTSFADWVDQQGPSAQRKYGAGPGQDWSDVAPATPESADAAAEDLTVLLWRENRNVGDGPRTVRVGLYRRALAADKARARPASRRATPNDFGHCLAMQAMGHGVSWFDDHATFPLKFPRHFEAHCFNGMEIDWSPRVADRMARANPARKASPGGDPWFRVYETSGTARYQVGFYKDLDSAKREADQVSGGYPREVVDANNTVMYRSGAPARRGGKR